MAYRKNPINSRPLWKGTILAALLAVTAACTTLPSADPSSAEEPGGSGASAQQAGDAAASRSIEDALYRVDTDDPVVFLTIDDGATRDQEMVDILDDAGVEATLFLTDQYVREDPEFFRRLRDQAGARIENHTLDHPDLTSVSPEEQRRQICETSDRYEEEFGRRPALLRPPYGSFDDDTLRVAAECGVTHLVHWSAEIQDGHIEFAVSDRLRPGDIVLMHFGDQFRDDINTFVEEARKSGLQPALLENYLK